MKLVETPKSAHAFALYCEMGSERSLAKVAEKIYGKPTVNLRQIEQWSSKYHWVDRAKAYDREQAALRQQRKQAEIEAMDQRHIVISKTLQVKMLKQIEELLQRERFGSQATVMALKYATDLERLAMGTVTERTEQIIQTSSESAYEYDPETADLIYAALRRISTRGAPTNTDSVSSSCES